MIRFLEHSEKQNIRPLYEQCFEEPKQYTDYYFENRIQEAQVAVCEEDGEMVSALHLIPKMVIIGEIKSRIFYIYGVCTDILHRNQGFMNKLFCQALHNLYEIKQPFTYLIPSDEQNACIYQKFGFSYVMDSQKTKPKELCRKPTHSLISRKAENADLVRLAIFAQTCTEKMYDITLCHDVEYFKKMKELVDVEGGQIEIYVEGKVIVGYRIWIDDEIMEEVLDHSIKGTMTWLSSEKKPYVMARIVNLKNIMKQLSVAGEGSSILRLSDPVIKENNGYFLFSYADGKIRIEQKKEETFKEKPKLELSIGELTAHIFGYKMVEGLPQFCSENGFFINDYV